MPAPLLMALLPGLIGGLGSAVGGALQSSAQRDVADKNNAVSQDQFAQKLMLERDQMAQQEEEERKKRAMQLAMQQAAAAQKSGEMGMQAFQSAGKSEQDALANMANQYRSILGG